MLAQRVGVFEGGQVERLGENWGGWEGWRTARFVA